MCSVTRRSGRLGASAAARPGQCQDLGRSPTSPHTCTPLLPHSRLLEMSCHSKVPNVVFACLFGVRPNRSKETRCHYVVRTTLDDLDYSFRQIVNLMQLDFLANSSRFPLWTIVVLDRQDLEPVANAGIIRAGLHQRQRHPGLDPGSITSARSGTTPAASSSSRTIMA
ncbi:hypothetical protein EDB85DRAFT_1445827 [Lactarius pseudohatsudake]|nr:hypothetical protein EDB85DRAFT_1445827 [Lactarius pseudohatsudake]